MDGRRLPGMVDALESGEPSAVVAFDAHGKAKAYGESEKDFAARRTSWLVAYGQANEAAGRGIGERQRRHPRAANPRGSGGGRGGDDQEAEAARPGATGPREKDTKLAQKLGQLQPFVAAQPASFGPA